MQFQQVTLFTEHPVAEHEKHLFSPWPIHNWKDVWELGLESSHSSIDKNQLHFSEM